MGSVSTQQTGEPFLCLSAFSSAPHPSLVQEKGTAGTSGTALCPSGAEGAQEQGCSLGMYRGFPGTALDPARVST